MGQPTSRGPANNLKHQVNNSIKSAAGCNLNECPNQDQDARFKKNCRVKCPSNQNRVKRVDKEDSQDQDQDRPSIKRVDKEDRCNSTDEELFKEWWPSINVRDLQDQVQDQDQDQDQDRPSINVRDLCSTYSYEEIEENSIGYEEEP